MKNGNVTMDVFAIFLIVVGIWSLTNYFDLNNPVYHSHGYLTITFGLFSIAAVYVGVPRVFRPR